MKRSPTIVLNVKPLGVVPWPAVAGMLHQLDGRDLTIEHDDDHYLTISGDRGGNYRCMCWNDDAASVLQSPSTPTSPQEGHKGKPDDQMPEATVYLGGVPVEVPQRQVVTLPVVLQVAQYYYDTGQLDDGHTWA